MMPFLTNPYLHFFFLQTERTIEVTLTGEERVEYTAIETEAKDFYNRFKVHARKELSKYYLQLSSALKAQRVAMSGGHAPLTEYDDLIKNKNNKGDESDSEDEDDNKKKKNKKAPVAFSEFAYTSKLKKLIEELKRIRDEEPGSKSLVFSNFSSTLKWLQEELPKEGFTFRHINGQMPQKKRAEALAAFQNDPPTTGKGLFQPREYDAVMQVTHFSPYLVHQFSSLA
jgi:SNF2 family DNA or RNA helicase